VVNVEGTDHALCVVDHQQATDLVRFHQLRGLYGQRVLADRPRRTGHDLGDTGGTQVDVLVVQAPAQVAVRVEAEQAPVVVDDSGHAQALVAHLDQRFADRGVGTHARHVVAAMHDIGNV